MVAHPGLQGLLTLLLQRVRGQTDHRQSRCQAQNLPGRLVAVDDRHLNIHQHHIEGLGASLAHQADHLAAVFGKGHLGALFAQQLFDDHAVDVHILGHQQAHPLQTRRAVGRLRRRCRFALRRRLSGLQRQDQGKGAALARLTLQLDPAGHLLGKTQADRQAQTGAAEMPRGADIGLMKRLEQRLLLRLADPDPGIANLRVQFAVAVNKVQRDRTLRREFHSV